MLAVRGIFENGKLILNEKIKVSKPIKVIVTFLDDIKESRKEVINLNQFSFLKSQKILQDYNGSISDSVIAERKSQL